MISNNERRFLRQWEEQRQGGKLTYVLLYTIIGTFITAIVFSIGMVIFYRIVFASKGFWIMLAASFVCSLLLTLYSWSSSEKKFRNIIRREINDPVNQ